MSQLEDIRAERLKKIAVMREKGIDPYPAESHRTHGIDAFLSTHAALETSADTVTIAGRIMSMREHGGSMFVDVFDGSGKAQAYLQKDHLGEVYDTFTEIADTSDIFEFSGTAFTTKRGMPSLAVTGWRILAKSLVPVPSEWYGIKDEDERYRKRYLDILLSSELAERIRRRSQFWNIMRSFLLERGFIEVETPVLETTTGGAEARPFETHHNALDIDVYLRISAGELWQKRLLVGGVPKVFEIGRIFRNEGISAEHAQDYTQLEFYQAYSDYREGMVLIQELYRRIAEEIYGTQTFEIRGHTVNFGAEWQTYDFCELMQDAYGFDPRDAQTKALNFYELFEKHGIEVPGDKAGMEAGRAVDLLWKELRKKLSGPGFLINVPVYMEPLAKKSSTDNRVVERFQVLIAGSEVGKGFSELNDPVDQGERFQHQAKLREAGDDEAQMLDADYIEALEYGMPPAFGFGVSERLFGFLEGVPLREAQLFPLMRPRK